MVRGIRGAITVEQNTADSIQRATQRLLQTIVERNQLELDQVVSVMFSVTSDLDAESPPYGARLIGWTSIPLFCAQEMVVKDGLSRCVRVLIHTNSEKQQQEIRHVYLDGATALRPDLAEGD